MYSISAINYVILTALLCGALFMFFQGLHKRWTLVASGKP